MILIRKSKHYEEYKKSSVFKEFIKSKESVKFKKIQVILKIFKEKFQDSRFAKFWEYKFFFNLKGSKIQRLEYLKKFKNC